MIDTILDLARFLTRAGLTIDELATRLGRITEDDDGGGPIRIASADARFEQVKLWRDLRTGAPYLIDVELAPEARMSVSELSEALGAFEPVHSTSLGAVPRIRFPQPVAKGHDFVATITARVDGPSERLETGTVTGLAILRDVRVD